MTQPPDDEALPPPAEPRARELHDAEAARARGLRPIPGAAARRARPAALGEVLGDVLAASGLGARVAQAKAVDDWPQAVGPQIAAVTEALWVTVDGTLVVRVATAAWRVELSLLAPTLLARLNAVPGRSPLTGIRFVHGAPRDAR